MSSTVIGLFVAELGVIFGLMYWLHSRITSAHEKIDKHVVDTSKEIMGIKDDIHVGNAAILDALHVAMADKMTEPQIQNYVVTPFKNELREIKDEQKEAKKILESVNLRLSKLQGMDERK